MFGDFGKAVRRFLTEAANAIEHPPQAPFVGGEVYSREDPYELLGTVTDITYHNPSTAAGWAGAAVAVPNTIEYTSPDGETKTASFSTTLSADDAARERQKLESTGPDLTA